jgi:hypothetical protein
MAPHPQVFSWALLPGGYLELWYIARSVGRIILFQSSHTAFHQTFVSLRKYLALKQASKQLFDCATRRVVQTPPPSLGVSI